MVVACGPPGIAIALCVLSLIQRIVDGRIGGDMDVQRAMIDIDDVCVIVMIDRHRRPVRSVRELVPALLDTMQAQHRHEGGAQTDAEGAKRARQG